MAEKRASTRTSGSENYKMKEKKKIIHWLDPALMEHKGLARYVCNQAVYPTANKSTNDPRDITCKNCLPPPNKALQKAIDEGTNV